MPKGCKTTKFFVIGAVAVLVIVFLSYQALAQAKPEVEQGEVIDDNIILKNGSYISPVFQADFNFNLAGIAWQGHDQVSLFLRFSNGQGWSDWYDLETTNYVIKQDWQYAVEPVLADQAGRLQYKIQTTGQVNQVKIIYINTSDYKKSPNWNFKDLFFSKVTAASELNIISRADWQADEDWRFNSLTEEVWPTEYQWPAKFVIHHTAGNDGKDDPPAAIRGVYYWHAVVLGWGDIGYNYVIDQSGNIYEGRYGGDGVIGAHVYRHKTCARERFGSEEYEADFNPGTIGIAVLGNYQDKVQLNEYVKNALANLIGHQAKTFDIEPAGESYLIDDIYPNIVGHKDLDCTDCPGQNLYSELDEIRSSAQTVYESLGGIINPVIKAAYVDQSEQPVVINKGETKEVWVEFRNDGNVTWRNYTISPPQVLAKSSSSLFYVAGWESDKSAANLTTPNVAPGEIGRFVFTIKAPLDQLAVTEQFELQFGDQILADTAFSIIAQITGFEYAAILDNQTIQPATFIKAKQTVTMQFKNRGTETWHQGDIKLNIYDLGYAASRYFDSSWPDQYGQIDFNEDQVRPNELATFTFTFASPDESGLYLNIYSLAGYDELVQEEDRSITRVDSTYQAELVSHNIPPAVLNVWRPMAEVKFRNTGLATWDQDTTLRVYDLGGQVNRFKHDSWLDNYTVAHLSQKTVKPGEVGTFTFRFQSPAIPGLYLNTFELSRGQSVVQGSQFSLITRVDE